MSYGYSFRIAIIVPLKIKTTKTRVSPNVMDSKVCLIYDKYVMFYGMQHACSVIPLIIVFVKYSSFG